MTNKFNPKTHKNHAKPETVIKLSEFVKQDSKIGHSKYFQITDEFFSLYDSINESTFLYDYLNDSKNNIDVSYIIEVINQCYLVVLVSGVVIPVKYSNYDDRLKYKYDIYKTHFDFNIWNKFTELVDIWKCPDHLVYLYEVFVSIQRYKFWFEDNCIVVKHNKGIEKSKIYPNCCDNRVIRYIQTSEINSDENKTNFDNSYSHVIQTVMSVIKEQFEGSNSENPNSDKDNSEEPRSNKDNQNICSMNMLSLFADVVNSNNNDDNSGLKTLLTIALPLITNYCAESQKSKHNSGVKISDLNVSTNINTKSQKSKFQKSESEKSKHNSGVKTSDLNVSTNTNTKFQKSESEKSKPTSGVKTYVPNVSINTNTESQKLEDDSGIKTPIPGFLTGINNKSQKSKSETSNPNPDIRNSIPGIFLGTDANIESQKLEDDSGFKTSNPNVSTNTKFEESEYKSFQHTHIKDEYNHSSENDDYFNYEKLFNLKMYIKMYNLFKYILDNFDIHQNKKCKDFIASMDIIIAMMR